MAEDEDATPPSPPAGAGGKRSPGNGRTTSAAPRSDRSSITRALTVAVVVLLVVALAVVVKRTVNRPAKGVRYTDLRPGDCLQRPDDTFVRADRVPCTVDHDLEVFALIDDPAPRTAKYPGQEILEREANVACPPQFQSYVGIPFEQSSLTVLFYVPTKANWEGGNRRLLCTVSGRAGRFKGSVKGAAR